MAPELLRMKELGLTHPKAVDIFRYFYVCAPVLLQLCIMRTIDALLCLTALACFFMRW